MDPQKQDARTAPRTREDGKVVTATGCLKQGERVGAFILTPTTDQLVERSGTPASEASGTTAGAVGTAGVPMPETTTYHLVPGDADLKLSEYVGRKVEVKGRIDREPEGAAVQTERTRTDAPAATPNDDEARPRVATTAKAKVEVQRLRVSEAKALGSCN